VTAVRVTRMLVLATLSLAACAKHEVASGLPDLPTIRANLAFTCTHEADHLPPLNPEADQLFHRQRDDLNENLAIDYRVSPTAHSCR
jgi:uncharacterized protein